MENENGRPPEEVKTVNQIVAWNIAWFRKAAGLKQEELGELLGRSKRNISADETSWGGGHTREFNAHELIGLSLALGVPLNAFFLPPLDDGTGTRYLFRPPGADEDMGMSDLMGAIVYGTEGDDSPAMAAYRARLPAAAGEYLEEGWQDIVAGWLADLAGPEEMEEGAYRLQAGREHLAASIAWLGRMADALDKAAKRDKEDEG